jgi:hypothetical protein
MSDLTIALIVGFIMAVVVPVSIFVYAMTRK